MSANIRRPEPMMVLIVDDHETTREALALLVQAEGFGAATATDGADALAYLGRAIRLPAVIVLDLAMPIMSGWDLITHLRASRRLCRIPIIIVTGTPYNCPHDLPVLVKPVDVGKLLAAIRERSACVRVAADGSPS